jgi:hypothetical protein
VDGQCREPICDAPCGEHAFCDTSVAPAECRCAAGYEGTPCAFTGLIQDPGFQEDPDTSPWIGDKGATVLPTLDGEGALDGDSVICNAGSLLQMVEMPSHELAEPFMVEVNYKAEGVHGLAVGFNRSWKRLPPTESLLWRTETFCLGEGGYGEAPNGGLVDVRLSASERHRNCDDPELDSRIRIDHFTIRPDTENECLGLEPSEVLNGSAEPNEAGWRFFKEDNAQAGFAPGEGRDTTSGARLARGAGETGRATMATQISVPLPSPEFPSPALRFWWRGSSGGLFDVELGTLVDLDDRGRQVDTLVGTGAEPDYIYCLPPWTHGSVLDLSFSLPDGDSSAVELVIDDVAITTDGDCGTEEDLLDPSFESAPNRWLGASVSSIYEMVLLQPDDPDARTGSGLIELNYDENAVVELAMETYVFVPQSEGDQGPAVTFHSMSPATPSTQVKWVLGRSERETGDVQTEITWQPNEVCLPAQWASRWFRLQVQVDLLQSPERQERILLDDFFLGTSPSCATQ